MESTAPQHTHHNVASSPAGQGAQVRRIYLATVVLFSLAFLLFAANGWLESRALLITELEHSNRLLRHSTRAVLSHQESVLRVLGRRLEDVGALAEPERGRRLIDQMLALDEAMAGFGLIRPDGQLVLVSGVAPGRPLPNLLAREGSRAGFLAALASERMVVGRTYYFPLLERWLVPVRLALRDPAGEVVLVMASGIDIDAEAALWGAITLKPGMRLALVRDDGYLQLALPSAPEDREALYAAPLVDRVTSAGDLATMGWNPRGDAGLTVSRRLAGYPLTVVAAYDWATLVTAYARRMAVPTLLYLAAMVIGWGVYRFLQRSQRSYEDELLHQATHDGLTQLPNRLLLEDRLHQDIARARRSGRFLAVMYLDLDQFKRVNDSFGHKVGDLLLKACAERLRSCLRAGDTVGRLGGDEFLMLFSDLGSVAAAQPLAHRVLETFARGFELDGRTLFSGASIGVAMYPHDGEDAATLLQNADTALYRAKDRGRNGVCFFEPEYNRVAARRVELENALRAALERDELTVVYQPKCDARSRDWEGAEALLRWHSAELGQVSPAEFIPVAEETGLIERLGERVLETALRDLSRIHAVAPGFTMAVNVSVRQFNNPGLVSGVLRLLNDHGIASELLELEVTESIMAHTVPQLEALREAGLRLAIDDFGTGFSSLSYLKRLPVTTLKLDREFVRDLETDNADKALITAMLAVARELDLHTVAEGVETEGQMAFLRDRGCAQVQGYLLARPMTLEDLLERLRGELSTAVGP